MRAVGMEPVRMRRVRVGMSADSTARNHECEGGVGGGGFNARIGEGWREELEIERQGGGGVVRNKRLKGVRGKGFWKAVGNIIHDRSTGMDRCS